MRPIERTSVSRNRTAWPSWQTNTTGRLGQFDPGGDDLWEIYLELAGTGIVDVRRVQADNTLNASLAAGDLNNRGDLELSTAGACRVTPGPVNGTFVARDTHFAAWSIGVAGGTQMVRQKFGLALYLLTEVLLQHRSDLTVQFLPLCS